MEIGTRSPILVAVGHNQGAFVIGHVALLHNQRQMVWAVIGSRPRSANRTAEAAVQ